MYQGKVLIFGAGASGRGHLGELLYRDGQRNLIFIDKNTQLVNMLKKAGEYSVRLLTDNETPGVIRNVTNVKALHRTEEAQIIEEFCDSNLVLTCVIAENLPDIAEITAKCIRARIQKNNTEAMNIVCCENLDHASSWLKKMVYEKLGTEEISFCEEYVGFPDAMISRVVPVPTAGSLDIVTEDYNEWTVDQFAFKGELPGFPNMHIVKNLDARLERKLWTHNGGHATLAYAAVLKGYPYIHVALADPELADFTVKVLDEIGNCVYKKYGNEFTLEEIRSYQADLGRRGAIAEMKDDISRVVRDPLRKLRINDRLLAPAVYAANHGIAHNGLVQAIVNATRYYSPADKESQEMQNIISIKGYVFFIEETLGLKVCPRLAEEIIQYYQETA